MHQVTTRRHVPRRRWRAAAVAAALATIAALGTLPAGAQGGATVVLGGLSSPKGLAATPNGNLLVAQGAFGPPGPVLGVNPATASTVDLTAPVGLVDVAPGRGAGWALGTNGRLYRFDPDRPSLRLVANIRAYQAGDPDPFDQEGNPTESNPYGLAVLGSDALVVDAANNDLLRVTPRGDITTVARFDVELVSTDHVPDPSLPPSLPAEAVPTSVTLGPGGSVLVGELKGFPFRPGSSRVWQVDPGATGAVCSTTTPDPACRPYAEHLTAIQDIAYDGAGHLYVYELAADGVFAFEEGFSSGDFPPAVLLRLAGASRTELAPGELSEPGGVAVAGGTVFATDGVFSSGRLVRIS